MPLGNIVYDERLNDTIEIAEEDGQNFLITRSSTRRIHLPLLSDDKHSGVANVNGQLLGALDHIRAKI